MPPTLPDGAADPGLVGTKADSVPQALVAFKAALAGHRSFARETDPPMV